MRLICALIPLCLASCFATQADIDAWNRLHARPIQATGTTEESGTRDVYTPPTIVHPELRDFKESLELPEDEFDLSLSLLLFAKEYGGASDEEVEHWLGKIDQWSLKLARRIRNMTSPKPRLGALRDMVHQELGFRFDHLDPKGFNRDNLMIHRVLSRKRGYCVTLSIVYLVLARGAGIDISGVRLPGHFAIASDASGKQVVLESTNGGRPRSSTELYVAYRMSAKSVEESGVFLTPLKDKEIFSTLFNNLGGLARLADNDSDAESNYRQAIELSPTNIEARYNLARILMSEKDLEKLQSAMAQLNKSIKLDPNFYHAYCARAALYHRTSERKRAFEDLRKARRFRPDLSTADVEEGVIHHREGNNKLAKTSFERALELNADNVDALRNLSIVESELGNSERSAELKKRYDELVPQTE